MNDIVKWVQWSTAEGGNGHWYGLVQSAGTSVTWQNAFKAAGTFGPNTTLASLNTQAEHDFVVSQLMNSSFNSRAWLGGVRDNTGEWKWLNGDTFGFTNWAPGEPNNKYLIEDKLQIYRDGNWNDASSSDRWSDSSYLIETDVAPLIPTPPQTGPATDTIVVRVSEDAYKGDAKFQLFVDYRPVGPVTSVTALHAQGQWQDFTFKTGLWAGAKLVSVVFLNDLYDGTRSTDRNLYLQNVTINGSLVAANNQEVKEIATVLIPTPPSGQKPFWLPWSDAATHTIKGTSAGDLLHGTIGNDRFEGGAGPDRMIGDAGDDTYLVSSSGDVVVEEPGGGTDSIRSWLGLTKLPDYVENLYLNGTAASVGLGNDFDNRLMGNANGNTLDGGEGNDILYGNGGADLLVGGAGNDIFGFLKLSDAGDTVQDFTPGTDMIDLQGLRKSLAQADPDAQPLIRFVQQGTGTAVVVYPHGEDDTGVTMVTLDHVAANQLAFGKDVLW
jgi:Ca2+-binding RTX toxin-like protein